MASEPLHIANGFREQRRVTLDMNSGNPCLIALENQRYAL